MMEKGQISAEEFLSRKGARLLDVRAEVEFEAGHLPHSVNLPLLHTAERHLVGLCYREQGQAEAVKLGYELVGPHKASRVEGWVRFLQVQPEPVLACFRGGMRSEISQSWLAEAGMRAARVTGGYRALRRELALEWEKPLSGFVVTGLTGSAKTAFLRSLKSPRAIDLEAMAVHRGSAFGGLFQPSPQPAQQTFENILAVELRQREPGMVIFEDESRLVGRCVIPPPFFEQLRGLPRIFLESSQEERVSHILEVYVREPLATREASAIMGELIVALHTIRNRLGGQAATELEAEIRRAFAAKEMEAHRGWIERLLLDYYDRLYTHAMSRQTQEPVFRGAAEDCREWLRKNSDLYG